MPKLKPLYAHVRAPYCERHRVFLPKKEDVADHRENARCEADYPVREEEALVGWEEVKT